MSTHGTLSQQQQGWQKTHQRLESPLHNNNWNILIKIQESLSKTALLTFAETKPSLPSRHSSSEKGDSSEKEGVPELYSFFSRALRANPTRNLLFCCFLRFCQLRRETPRLVLKPPLVSTSICGVEPLDWRIPFFYMLSFSSIQIKWEGNMFKNLFVFSSLFVNHLFSLSVFLAHTMALSDPDQRPCGLWRPLTIER